MQELEVSSFSCKAYTGSSPVTATKINLGVQTPTKHFINMITANYDLFNFLDINRNIDRGLVKRLKKSIEENGYLPSKGIMVDKNFNILDGQHRFTACKELGIPIFFEIYEGDKNVRDIILACNSNQLIWRLETYIVSNAKEGIECYKKFVEFEEKYKLGVSNCIIIFPLTVLEPSTIKKSKPFELNPDAERIADFLYQLKELPFWKEKNFVTAVRRLFNKATDLQVFKIKQNYLIIRKQADASQYLTVFENIINKGAKNKISLF